MNRKPEEHKNRLNQESYRRHRSKHLLRFLRYYQENRERLKKKRRERWLKQHPKAWRKWKAKEAARRHAQTTKLWRRENADRHKANKARRYYQKKKQLHSGSSRDVEAFLYREAQWLTKTTGVVHHVDHIIPLELGGWHHHLNLQILSAPINLTKTADPFWERKGCKSWRDVPEELWPSNLAPGYRKRLRGRR